MLSTSRACRCMPLASRMMMSTLHFESSSASAARVRSIISKSSGRARSRAVRGSLTSCAPLGISLGDICAPSSPRRPLGPVGDVGAPARSGFGPGGQGNLRVREAAGRRGRGGGVKDGEGVMRVGGELEVGAVTVVGDTDGQLVRDLVPEQHDLETVVRSVCELSVRLVRRLGAFTGDY